MKKLFYMFLAFLGCVIFLLVSCFKQPSAEINKITNRTSFAVPDTQFQIGAIQCGIHSMYNYTKNSLGFNVWHQYTGIESGWEGTDNDIYYGDADRYSIEVKRRISNNANNNGMRTYMDRPIVEYVVSGQRMDYQCESVPMDNIYWFYSYDNSVSNSTIYDVDDDSQFGTGERVKHCKRDNVNPGSNAGWINTGIKANRNLSNTGAANVWCNDNYWDWYVMPRIRIDQAYANAPGGIHDTETVCRIVITGWRNDIVKNISLKIINFKDINDPIYNGNYLEKFYFRPGQDTLGIPKKLINDYFLPQSGHWVYEWKDTCKVDIKIYWAGKVDMWIDRVRLENEPAHQYMTLKNDVWINKINAEINWAQNTAAGQIPNYFYFEEFTLSHVPAIAALNKQILANSQNSNSLIVWLNNYQINEQTPHFLDGHLFAASQLREIFQDTCKLNTMMIGCYPFGGFPISAGYSGLVSYHPNTLYDGDFDSTKGILSYKKSSSQYDDWIQEHLDAESGIWDFTHILKLMDTLSDNYGMRIINCTQAHLFYLPGGYLKEPSNEEIELQTDLAITYNAKGIMYYIFDSWGNLNSPQNGYSRGIMDLSGNTLVPRNLSQYGQNKYAKIQELSAKLNKWGPYIMKFDATQTNSCIYRIPDERTNFLNNTYFNEIRTSVETPNTLCANLVQNTNYEIPNRTYIQAATFKNINAKNTSYFMIVNRRCSPGDDDCSGRRFVTVIFDSNNTSDFDGFNNWKIIDLANDSTVAKFDKRTSTPISLGKYIPGEGKLYKIVPIM